MKTINHGEVDIMEIDIMDEKTGYFHFGIGVYDQNGKELTKIIGYDIESIIAELEENPYFIDEAIENNK